MEFSETELNEILNIFKYEGLEIVDSMDNNLLELEKQPKNQELILQLFRDAHSLKGSARMLGFNSMQSLMHKVEDLIGLFKERKIYPHSEILEIISKTVEYIKLSIEKTVEMKTEYSDENYEQFFTMLNSVFENQEKYKISDFEEEQTEENQEKQKENFPKIENLITKILYYYTLIRQNADFSFLKNLQEELEKLNEISASLTINDFKETIIQALQIATTLSTKTNEDYKNSQDELSMLDVSIDKIISIFTSYCEEHGINHNDYYAEVFIMLENKNTKKKEVTSVENIVKNLIENIKSIDIKNSQKEDIETNIKKIKNSLKEKEDANIFDLLSNIISYYQKHDKIPERDTKEALCNILDEYINPEGHGENKALLVQRLKIVLNIAHINIENLNQKNEAQRTENFSSSDWLSNINSSSIKTLRVDSSRLDKLVNQIGELIVTRIKNTEHVSIIKNIQNDFVEWQKSWNKLGHFIKYFDKKYLNNAYGTSQLQEEFFQNMSSYNKQLIYLYANHGDKFHNILSQIDLLHKNMQEQDVSLNTITNELESMVKNMRILPLATIFHLFPRMIHNIAKEKSKKIDFRVQGSEVSVDKKIIEDIKIPLMHIIRNSIDHGIETPGTRRERGKNETGTIVINAEHKEDKIIITVKDDGQGLDVEKIRQKALDKGFLTIEEAEKLPDDEIVNIIFYPGFSTEETITELSGRGLGLDIVHTKISQLNGKIDIATEYGKGTITTIELPATMATMKAFIAMEAEQLFVFPAASIKTVIRINTDEIFLKENKNYFVHNNKVIPVYTLSQILKFENTSRKEEKYTLLIIESENSQIGIIVQKLIGEEEILHKKLPAPFCKVKNISGITTLANGNTCLILNITDILNYANKRIFTKIVSVNTQNILQNNSQYKILVVDDSKTTRILEKNIIESRGYNVRIATSALDALNIMQRNEFDLIITDNEMPEMSGLEFVEEIRRQEKYMTLPIMVLTSNPRDIWESRFMVAGANHFIQKSEFNQEMFIEKIGELLKCK
ncbi:hybrid sensor histidine kinase/response regulator [bacterium]|nr:hybrid sensor histidine kinase/response regulator [bacterium]